MNNDEKILKNLETLQAYVKDVKQGQTQTNDRLSKLEDGQAHLKTAVEAVKAGQDDIRDTMVTKADFHDLRVEVISKIKDNTNRIEELEKDAGIPHPHKH